MILTIIITCHNHENFLEEAIKSAIDQKLQEKQIIVIENGSSDGSANLLKTLEKQYPQLLCIYKDQPENYCKVFNEAFQLSKGEFIVDQSADDILLPEFSSKAVYTASFFPSDFGVVFCNAEYITEDKKHLGYHFPVYEQTGKTIEKPEDGFIYKTLVERHHISAPTMVIKREVLEDLNGYDENLEYEDFDFWVRSSRNWRYVYVDYVCVRVRKHSDNLGKKFYKRNQGNMLWSTFKVCKKAQSLNQTEEENEALHKRCSYHLRQALFTEHFKIARAYFRLIKEIGKPLASDRFFNILATLRWPVYPFYRRYIRNRYSTM